MPYDAASGTYILPTVDVIAESWTGEPGALPTTPLDSSAQAPTAPTDSGFWYNFDTGLATLFGGLEKTLGLYTAYVYAKQRARTGQVLTSPEQTAGQTYLMGEAFGQSGILWIVILVGLVVVLMFAIKT